MSTDPRPLVIFNGDQRGRLLGRSDRYAEIRPNAGGRPIYWPINDIVVIDEVSA